MELWQSLLVVFGGNAVLLVMLAFFSRSLMDTLLAKNVEQFKNDLASASQIAIERLRADLRLTAIEHEVRFSRLHEKRAECWQNSTSCSLRLFWRLRAARLKRTLADIEMRSERDMSVRAV